MLRRSYLFVLAPVLLYVCLAGAQESQYPIRERIAQKDVQKYQTSSYQELAMQKSQPPTGERA
jgi:hypothetical protein